MPRAFPIPDCLKCGCGSGGSGSGGDGPPVDCPSGLRIPYRINVTVSGYPAVTAPLFGAFLTAPNAMPTPTADTISDKTNNPINLLSNATYSLRYYTEFSAWAVDGIFFDPIYAGGSYREPFTVVPGDGVVVDYYEIFKFIIVNCPTVTDPPGSGVASRMQIQIGSGLLEYRVGVSTPSSPYDVYSTGLIYKGLTIANYAGDWDVGSQTIVPALVAGSYFNSGWGGTAGTGAGLGGTPPTLWNVSAASYNHYRWIDYDDTGTATGAEVNVTW